MSYCMFEPPEILKFIFYIYDQDKEGFIDAEELKKAMNTLHEIEVGCYPDGGLFSRFSPPFFRDFPFSIILYGY